MNTENITRESAASRLVQKFADDDIRFAVIGGCLPGTESTRDLHNDIRALGFRYNRFTGKWTEGGEPKEEYSMLVPNISLKKALVIGSKHDRQAVIYKDKNGCRMYCASPFDSYSAGDVIKTFETDKENPLDAETAARIFSSGKNETAENFRLTERVLVSTFYGFTEEEVDLTELNAGFKKPYIRELSIKEVCKGVYNIFRFLINEIQYDECSVIQSGYSSSERHDFIDKSEGHGIIVLPEDFAEKEEFLELMNSPDNKYYKHTATGYFLKNESGTYYFRNTAFSKSSLCAEVIGLSKPELIYLCEKIIRELSADTVILKTEPDHSLFFINNK